MPWRFFFFCFSWSKHSGQAQWRTMKKSVLMAEDHKGVMAHNSFGGRTLDFVMEPSVIALSPTGLSLSLCTRCLSASPPFFFPHYISIGVSRGPGFDHGHFTLSPLYRQFYLAHSPAVNRPWIVTVTVSSREVPNPGRHSLLPHFASYNWLHPAQGKIFTASEITSCPIHYIKTKRYVLCNYCPSMKLNFF